jgi:undecaprenyl diphosphate synthase
MADSKVPAPPGRLPEHIVLIPDGNGRWASAKGKPVPEGHRKGAKAVECFLRACREWQIPHATVWAFSTENWSRSRIEVSAIMRLVEGLLRKNRKKFKRDGVRFRHIGRKDRIADAYPGLANLMKELEQETVDNSPFNLNLALDYGGRDELVRAVTRLVEAGRPAAEITWEAISELLDTATIPDPDLIIRSSGEYRLSGILPMQSVYAEIVFVSRFLPELEEEDFREAIREFSGRQRRFGQRAGLEEVSEGVNHGK